MTHPIPISAVDLPDGTEDLVLEVLRSGHLAQGPMVERLESQFAEMTGAAHAVAVSSGTTALVAAIEALRLEPGDEVVTSPFTFVATLNAIIEAGATAVFADIRSDDFTLDPDAVAAVVGPRTRALLPVHLYGQAADLDAFEALGRRHGLAIVEDAAQAHGATVAGRPVGRAGQACFSLYATKNVCTGEGGVVTTDDHDLADALRVLRNQGMRRRYEYEVAGHNYRMTDLQAAVGIPQMERLETVTAARRANAAALDRGLEGVAGVTAPFRQPRRGHVFHQYTVRVGPGSARDRDALATALTEAGVGCGVYYPRVVFDYDCYRESPQVRASGVPNAELAAREVLSLPVHPLVTDSDIDRICTTVAHLTRFG